MDTSRSPDRRPVLLVTGATGFLGGELLLRLLTAQLLRPMADRHLIVCAVRAGSARAATDRGRKRLRELLGREPTMQESDLVLWVRSDLETRRLGWNSATWQTVADRLAEVFHCAASVTFDLPLAEAQRINVDGTRHVFELAVEAQNRHADFERFHHVSTAFVSGKTAGSVTSDHLPGDRARNFRNTYERTKARAERFLRDQRQVPVSIYRPSVVGGHTTTGRTTNWNVLYVPMKMAARGHLPVFPRHGRALIDTVGVDYVVDAMVALRSEHGPTFRSYHLTAGAAAFDVNDLIARTRAKASCHDDYAPSKTRLLSPIAWSGLSAALTGASRLPEAVGALRKSASIGRAGMATCGVYVPYTRVDTVFETADEHRRLARHGVTLPEPIALLDTLIDYGLAHNFGRIPDTDYRWPQTTEREPAEPNPADTNLADTNAAGTNRPESNGATPGPLATAGAKS